MNMNDEGEIDFTADAASDTGLNFAGKGLYLKCDDVQSLAKDGSPLRTKKGDPMFVLEMVNLEGPDAGKRLWHYLCFIPAGKPGHGLALKCLKAFGLPCEGAIRVKPTDFVDRTIKVDVEIEQSNPQFDPKSVIKKFHTVEAEEEQREPATTSTGLAPGVTPASQGLKAPAAAPVARKPLPWGGRR
jgi:hypothetical protein